MAILGQFPVFKSPDQDAARFQLKSLKVLHPGKCDRPRWRGASLLSAPGAPLAGKSSSCRSASDAVLTADSDAHLPGTC